METFNNVINSGQLVLVDFFAAIGYFIGSLALAIQVHIIIILVIKKNAAKLIKKRKQECQNGKNIVVADDTILRIHEIHLSMFCYVQARHKNPMNTVVVKFLITLIQVSQAQKLKELKELSLPTVAEELRQQSFWHSFLSCKTYVLTP